MARGAPAEEGATRVSQNGYHYTKSEGSWRFTHHIIAETKLGRPLSSNERVTFRDGDRTNLAPGNLVIRPKHTASMRKRIVEIELKIKELQYEREQLIKTVRAKEKGKLLAQQA